MLTTEMRIDIAIQGAKDTVNDRLNYMELNPSIENYVRLIDAWRSLRTLMFVRDGKYAE